MGVGPAWHQDFEPSVVADQVGGHVAEDGGGGHHEGSVVLAGVVGTCGEEAGGEYQRGESGEGAPRPNPNQLTEMRIIPIMHTGKVPEDQSCDNSRSEGRRQAR